MDLIITIKNNLNIRNQVFNKNKGKKNMKQTIALNVRIIITACL